MQRSLSFVSSVVATLAIGVIALSACVGDDPASTAPTGDGGSSSGGSSGATSSGASSGTSTSGGSSGASSSGDGGGCIAPLAACEAAGQCTTDTNTNPKHCGTCDHDCGANAQCSAGICQPITLQANVNAPVSVSVNSGGIFWLEASVLRSCAKTGCGGSPTILAQSFTNVPGESPRQLYVDEDNAWWLGRPDTAGTNEHYILKCATAGCSKTPTQHGYYAAVGVLVGNTASIFRYDGTGSLYKYPKTSTTPAYLTGVYLESSMSFAADDTYLAFTNIDTSVGGNAGVYTSDITAGAPTKKLIMDSGRHITMTGGFVYASRNTSPTQSNIHKCVVAGTCGGTGTPLLASADGLITDVLADATGVYWAVMGDPSGATGAIRRCALPDCAGGPKDLAKNQANPTALALDGDFVYWANRGGAANTGSIMRVRK
jgi:hypothetical protein